MEQEVIVCENCRTVFVVSPIEWNRGSTLKILPKFCSYCGQYNRIKHTVPALLTEEVIRKVVSGLK